MSHTTRIRTEMRDLERAAEAARAVGLELRRGQQTARMYGGRQERCQHAIVDPETRGGYEIGLTAQADGTFTLACDFWHGSVARKAGEGLATLKREYTVATVLEKAKGLARRGFVAHRENQANGHVVVRLRRR